jgi:hypothetical protein
MPKTYTSLIVSHQARLRCIMHRYGFGIMVAPASNKSSEKSSLFSKMMSKSSNPRKSDIEWDSVGDESLVPRNLDYDYDSDYDISNRGSGGVVIGGSSVKVGQVASFKNAAIIRLVITKESVKASLVVSGIIDAKENKSKYTYFVRPDEMGKSDTAYTEVPFQDYSTPNNFHDVGDDTYVFYLVRHGQAEHNVLKGIGKAFSYKDTSLTSAGKEQATDSGIKLTSEIIKNSREYKYPDFLFASDLKRTRQTLLQIMKGMPSFKEKLGTKRDIIILPCAHELRYKYDPESATCDAKQGTMGLPWTKTPNENISTCTRDTCSTPGTIKQITYNNDWNSYYDFYSNHTRATRPFFKSCLTCPKEPAGKKCRDTDMITQAIEHIASPNVSRMSLNTMSKRDFFDNGNDDSDDDDDSEDDETTRETIRVNPVPSEYRNQYTKLGGKKRSKKTRRAVKTRRGRRHTTKKAMRGRKHNARKTRRKHKNKKNKSISR